MYTIIQKYELYTNADTKSITLVSHVQYVLQNASLFMLIEKK